MPSSPFAFLAAKVCFGAEAAVDLSHGKCPSCHQSVHLDEIRDRSSRDEYELSGLCQQCQDVIFVHHV